MKKGLNMKACLIAMAMLVPAVGMAQDKVETSVGADLVSGYVWRGQELGGASIQPAMSIAYKGLSLGAWGSVCVSSLDAVAKQEFDLTLGYSLGNFSVSVTDYWFSYRGADPDYFNYGDGTAHVLEAQVGYDFGFLSANWYTNIAGADGENKDGKMAYSSYIALAAPFTLGGLDWTAEVGATPWGTSFYGTEGFALCDVSLGASKSIPVTESFSLPLFTKVTWNPSAEAAYFVVGVSF